ncbi:MAG: hypothetical protein AMJ42_05530 [Deltaproteobacteria bacterium DG_8]|nr:MAG: hypothetical protein AMJ42_05530 [Deltaproteobacteria bacterium DG_8]
MKKNDKKRRNDLKSHLLRSTRQRAIIIEVLKGVTMHPSADWIYDKVRKRCPNVSLGTIYRNLNLLKEKGLIKELKFGKNAARYDGNFEPHHHIYCLECGKLEDVQCKVHPNLTKRVEKTNGYKIVTHQLEFNGICPECLQKLKKKI